MPYLLNLVYLVVLVAASPFLAWKALRTGKYREGWGAKLLGRVPRRQSDRPCFWFHAVSVGEVNLLTGLVREIEQHAPEVECVVSTTTRTGMELARKRYPGLTVFYCPMDFSWAIRAALRRIRPNVLVLAELELWPNLIRLARAKGTRVAVVNGRLSESSYRGYRRIRPLVASVLRRIDVVAAQNETYAERFRQLGTPTEQVIVTGSMKYDGAQTDRNNPKTQELRQLAGLADDEVIFLAGSTQDPEERLALDAWRKLSIDWPRLRLILVPRHPERFDAVARMLDESGIAWQRRTALGTTGDATEHVHASVDMTPSDTSVDMISTSSVPHPTSPTPSLPVLLIDVIGELGAWWGTAQIAYVGGSMGSRGGQNMIEPAAYGAAVCFGPNTWNFRDVVEAMLAAEGAEVVNDGLSLENFVRRMLKNPDQADRLGERAQALVTGQQGATARTRELVLGLYSPISSTGKAV